MGAFVVPGPHSDAAYRAGIEPRAIRLLGADVLHRDSDGAVRHLRLSILLASMQTATDGFLHVGQRRRRADSPERLTGRTRFTNDLLPSGALFTRFVRSPYASAKLVSVDGSA